MNISDRFAPFEDIAVTLLPHAVGDTNDAAHDAAHLSRVWTNVQTIAKEEGGDLEILVAATLLHDCVDIPKTSPQRSQASRLAAAKATTLLKRYGWKKPNLAAVGHAIEAHSFSAQIKPTTIEAKILQDADRLDALGHIGIARCFYVSGRIGRRLYDPADPNASDRELNDLAFTLDHFKAKLLGLSASFQTSTGQTLAAERGKVVENFLDGFLLEIDEDRAP